MYFCKYNCTYAQTTAICLLIGFVVVLYRVLHIQLSCSWSFSIAPHGAYTNMPGALANLSFIKVDVWWARFSFSRRLSARSRCLCHLRILLNENGSVPHFNIVLVFNSIYVLMWVDAVNTEIAFILDRYSPILFPAPCRTLFQQFFFFEIVFTILQYEYVCEFVGLNVMKACIHYIYVDAAYS